jgi:hypothetical protein
VAGSAIFNETGPVPENVSALRRHLK